MHSRARIAATIAKLLVCMLAVVCPGRSERTPGLGIVVTSQRVRIGNAVAPTGTTLFSGDVVSTFEAPAQVMLWGGSRVELLGASAAFSRPGDTLVIEARWGLLCFNIRGGERVRIKAPGGEFEVLSDAGPHVGSLAANANGQLALSLCQGAISGLAPGTEEGGYNPQEE